MGAGKKFSAWNAGSIGLGFSVGRFPFALTINAQFLLWGVSIGFGKGYDE